MVERGGYVFVWAWSWAWSGKELQGTEGAASTNGQPAERRVTPRPWAFAPALLGPQGRQWPGPRGQLLDRAHRTEGTRGCRPTTYEQERPRDDPAGRRRPGGSEGLHRPGLGSPGLPPRAQL